MLKMQKFYPDSDCRNFGVPYIDDMAFWEKALNSVLSFDEYAVGIIQKFHLCVDTGREATSHLLKQSGISPDVAACIKQMEGQFIDNKVEFVRSIEEMLGKQINASQKEILLTSVQPTSRIKDFNFLLWHSSEIEEPHSVLTCIIYEEGDSLFLAIFETLDGVSPDRWVARKTTWDTLLADVYDPAYLTLRGSNVLFDSVRRKIIDQFPEQFA